jgi:hypothetical protein
VVGEKVVLNGVEYEIVKIEKTKKVIPDTTIPR